MAQYLLSHNPNPKFSTRISPSEFCGLFLDICALESVRGDIAFAQACKETGYFQYGGDVCHTQNNFAGLGATGGVPGCSFPTIQAGILAQAQHLKAYATKDALTQICVDPRRSTWFVDTKGGTSPDVETLGGTWAVPGYDTRRYRSLEEAHQAKASYGYQIISILNDILQGTSDESGKESLSQQSGNKMTLNIHAGHNPDGKTACGAVGLIKESTEARSVKEKTIALLRAQGHTVYDCTVDNGTSQNDVLQKIVAKCNAHTVDLDISLHFNAGANQSGDGRTTGTEVYVYSAASKARAAAQRIADAIAALGFQNRGVKYAPTLYVLKHTKAPALLVEICFVDDPDDVERYHADLIARAIVQGITAGGQTCHSI